MTPEEKLAAHKKVTDSLVKFGLASRVLIDVKTGQGSIEWTPGGTVFRKHLASLYKEIAQGKGKEGMGDLMEILTWIMRYG
jgi:hypothetical protein